MWVHARQGIWTAIRGLAAALRGRRGAFGLVTLGVFLMNLALPVAVLSLARKPVDYFTFNPWLSRLPEYLVSHPDSLRRKLEFLADMALAWFLADSPVEGVEWGFIVDVPSVARFALTSLLFGAFSALWLYRRGQGSQCGVAARAVRYGGVSGAVTATLGFTTAPCSVMGCGVPVLPVVGLAVTGVSSGALAFFGTLARVSTTVILVALVIGIAWLAWVVGRQESPQLGLSPRRHGAT